MWFNYEVIELYISVDAQFTWNVTVLVGALVVGGEGGGLTSSRIKALEI